MAGTPFGTPSVIYDPAYLAKLNTEQRRAVIHGSTSLHHS
jgi:hypothetical protein